MPVMRLIGRIWCYNTCLFFLEEWEVLSTRHAVGKKISHITEKQIWKIFSLNGLGSLFLL